jgi:hypothetical protein
MGDIESYAEITITSAGLDHVSEDGVLTAELGVLTANPTLKQLPDPLLVTQPS